MNADTGRGYWEASWVELRAAESARRLLDRAPRFESFDETPALVRILQYRAEGRRHWVGNRAFSNAQWARYAYPYERWTTLVLDCLLGAAGRGVFNGEACEVYVHRSDDPEAVYRVAGLENVPTARRDYYALVAVRRLGLPLPGVDVCRLVDLPVTQTQEATQ